MTVSAVSSYQDTLNNPEVRVVKKTLDSDDFMKLLSVQFQSQDPMKPMEDTAFIAQMAQFSALSQTQTLTAEMAKLSASQSIVTANSYIGRQVTVADGKGGTTSGNVGAVEMSVDGPRIVIGEKTYPISAVLLVEPGTVTTLTTPPAGDGGV